MGCAISTSLAVAWLAACGSPAGTPLDAEVDVVYDGTLTISPGAPIPPEMIAATVSLSATAMFANGCTLPLRADDNGALSFGDGPCTGQATHATSASAIVAGTMLTAHWSEIGFDDALTHNDFVGTQVP